MDGETRPGSLALFAYRRAMGLATPLAPLILSRRERRGKEDPARRPERVGCASRARPGGPLVWVHGASVGEAGAALPVIERLGQRDPRASVLLTTGTVTSARVMADRLPPHAIHQFVPVDCPRFTARFLDHWRPDAALWLESDLWPCLLDGVARRRIPAALLNARLSERSLAAWRRAPRALARLLGTFHVVQPQNPDQADRLGAAGARGIAAIGNLKRAARPPEPEPDAVARLAEAIGDRPRWLAISTHPGEEELCAAAHRALRDRHPGLLTLVVPRHPDRGAALATALSAQGLTVARRSQGAGIDADTDLYLADTLGEVPVFLRVADVALVGGSFGDLGGHNPLEPADQGVAVLHGPDMASFSETAEDLARAGGAITVRDAESLAAALGHLFADDAARVAIGAAARTVTAEPTDLLDRVMAALEPILPARTDG